MLYSMRCFQSQIEKMEELTMPYQIICTVGTSLLSNRDNRPWAGWSPRDKSPLPDKHEVDNWLKTADVNAASAETNTISRLDLNENDSIVLLHSDTVEGRFCAEKLKNFYDRKVRSAKLVPIGQLGYSATQFTSGLKALVNEVIKLVHQGQENRLQTRFCATGGFKAEIVFLNLIGALLGVEVVYIHEQHGELVRLPRLPLTWDTEFVTQNDDFFRWIDEEPRNSIEVESWLKSRPELRTLVEDDDDGYTYLSAAGDLLYRVAKERHSMGPRVSWPKADAKPPADKKHVSTEEHHRPTGWRRFVDRLCAIDCVTSVRYDARAIGKRVKIIDADNGVIGVSFGETGNELPLRVNTTARGEEQTELVAEYIKKRK